MPRQSFSERMAQSKEIAANRRYNGHSVGCHASWKASKAPAPMSLDSLERYLNQWRKDQSYYAYLAVEAALFPDIVEF